MRFTAASVSIAILMSSVGVVAQERAEVLFDRGLADMLAGQHETACPLLLASYKLDPLPGVLFTLAECEAQRGRLATAVAHYDAYLAMYSKLSPERQAAQRGRDAIAMQQRALLDRQAPRITLTLGQGAPNDTVVFQDGVVLAADQIGRSLSVDPGDHVIAAKAPGRPVTEVRISLSRGEKRSIVLEVLPEPVATPRLIPEPARIAPKPPLKLADGVAIEPKPQPDEGTIKRRRDAYLAVGVGGAWIVAGGVTGALAAGQLSVIDANCKDIGNDVANCNSAGKIAADRAKVYGNASSIAFGIGLGLVGLGVVLYATAPNKPRALPLRVSLVTAGYSTTGVRVEGAWP